MAHPLGAPASQPRHQANLHPRPAFFLKPAADKVKHHEAFYFTQNGSEATATYALRHVDPASTAARNTYAAALFDSHNPEILYGEVLSNPAWTLPSLSLEETRKNGGVTPPPQPIFPTDFTIDLYNPDQRVTVTQLASKWGSPVSYAFSMPETTFRTPSASSLDRSQNAPPADATTPHINFVWRKEGRKDMTCYLTGKSTDVKGKKAKKSKEPDIAVALFSGLKEVTIMESNLYRVEMEDYKGLEVVILLGAAVIRDLFFGNPKEAYHIVDATTRKNSGGLGARNGSLPTQPPAQAPANVPPHPGQQQKPRQVDPQVQREAEAAAREQKRQEELRARERRRREEEEERKTRQFLQDEERRQQQAEKERRRRQAEVDKETERLRRQFGDQTHLLGPARPVQRPSAPHIQIQSHPPRPGPQAQRPQSSFLSNGLVRPEGQPKMKAKKSFWGLRSSDESNASRLKKKQSSMF